MDTEKQPHAGGRPTDYVPEFCEKAANLCIAGATDFEVAQELGVHVSTLYRWKAIHPEFREALKVGKELADDRIESTLYHRAAGYSYPALKIMQDKGEPVIVPYTEHVPPDIGAITLWLTNRRADKWRSKQLLEHTGANGDPIQFAATMSAQIDAATTSDSALSLYQKLLSGEVPAVQPQAMPVPAP